MIPTQNSSGTFHENDNIQVKETLDSSLSTLDISEQTKDMTLAYLLATTGIIPSSYKNKDAPK